ncbi:hypothetical protein LGK95_18280 [Clostridium algoriphilum]|uniref:hypothetical protein n=1 Tax=Clostridium algoriphilum TaxID=198347 RepID=UPI001CF3D06F|nr:hypothetical protein [Clostridium algoriphilum]MCB2295433.1 hypothetical protein [Clostridium algoriphilum]
MAIQKGKIKSMFTNENVLGVKEHNSLLQEKEEVLTPVPELKKVDEPTQSKHETDTVADDPAKSKPKRNIAHKKVINKTEAKEEPAVKTKEEPKETKVIENNSPIQLTLKTQNRDKKKYVTFYMRESTIALIAEYAGRGAGKDRTGYDKSEFVDLIIVKAINALKFNKDE